jgi:hypothetical protein
VLPTRAVLARGYVMMNKLLRFAKDASGAVTVDWVVLTASVLGFSIALTVGIYTSLNDSAQVMADGIADTVEEISNANDSTL